jgi:hypothetical protein
VELSPLALTCYRYRGSACIDRGHIVLQPAACGSEEARTSACLLFASKLLTKRQKRRTKKHRTSSLASLYALQLRSVHRGLHTRSAAIFARCANDTVAYYRQIDHAHSKRCPGLRQHHLQRSSGPRPVSALTRTWYTWNWRSGGGSSRGICGAEAVVCNLQPHLRGGLKGPFGNRDLCRLV